MIVSNIKQEDVVGLECRHVTYCLSEDGKSDLHVAKEYIHLKDGTRIPNIRLFRNRPREFWVTKEGFRNHQDKKEYEEVSRLQRYTTTQCNMFDSISRALYGRPTHNPRYKQLANSPYLYGSDIASTALLKNEYQTKYKDIIEQPAAVAVLDIETDVIRGTSEIILITLSFKDKIITVINSSFIPECKDPINNSKLIIDNYLGDLLKKRGATVQLLLCDNAADCCAEIFKAAHEWKPDFITLWNINFDLPIIISTLKKGGYDLANVFSDPTVPREYRFFKYTEGPRQKVTQSGKIMPLHWADRWHTVECPASFYFIDEACLYKRVRLAKGMEPSYSLDAILNKEIGIGKLSIPEVDHLDGLAWHIAMQKQYPFHYVAYNIFDCVGVELLDEKTNDLARTFPILCGISDYKDFNKNPRRIVDDMHFYYRGIDCVIATTGNEIGTDDNDELVVGMKGWIVTLPAHLMAKNGLKVIKELPEVRSMVYIHEADIDIEGTYPKNEEVANTAKETTYRELAKIEGMSEDARRKLGINLSGGIVNAIQIGVTAYKLPTPSKWLDLYDSVI